MTQLSRKPDNDKHRPGGWFVYWGDVRVGHIGPRAGVPVHEPQWGWNCGFYPGCDPGQSTNGTAENFEEARAGFERDWVRLLPTRTEAHFELWRRKRDWEAWKQKMWDEHRRLPSQNTSGQSHCFCGAEITSNSVPTHIQKVHRGIGA